jgi:potassium uptake TrkH family protein
MALPSVRPRAPAPGRVPPGLGHRASAALAGLRLGHPAQFVVLAFAVAVMVGTGLLMLPWAAADGRSTEAVAALFTATSAVCVTGLTVVDTPGHWSGFGEAVILLLIQAGGLGIMVLATLLGLLVSRRLGLRRRLMAQTETKTLGLGDVRKVVARVVVMSLSIEAALAIALTLRWWAGYDEPPGRAAYLGVFHAVSAFNNAGFALYPDNLVPFVGDAWLLGPICAAVVVGGLGFPVLFELWREAGAPWRWSVHTKITVLVSAILLVGGFGVFCALEWSNDATLGPLPAGQKLVAGLTLAVMPRTAGFNTIDYADALPETLLVTDVLMFIGGGSAGTAGGIKVTTFALLGFVILAEIRGDPEVSVFRRTLPVSAIRQALTVALLGVALVVTGTLALELAGAAGLEASLFESVSAFATVGLSTGITANLPTSAHLVLVVLMFTGRLGTITVASALALRERRRLYRYADERPVIG